jgi:hypothetical protein
MNGGCIEYPKAKMTRRKLDVPDGPLKNWLTKHASAVEFKK